MLKIQEHVQKEMEQLLEETNNKLKEEQNACSLLPGHDGNGILYGQIVSFRMEEDPNNNDMINRIQTNNAELEEKILDRFPLDTLFCEKNDDYDSDYNYNLKNNKNVQEKNMFRCSKNPNKKKTFHLKICQKIPMRHLAVLRIMKKETIPMIPRCSNIPKKLFTMKPQFKPSQNIKKHCTREICLLL